MIDNEAFNWWLRHEQGRYFFGYSRDKLYDMYKHIDYETRLEYFHKAINFKYGFDKEVGDNNGTKNA